MNAPIIAAEAITAGYGPMPVINEVELEVRAGEVVALLGANGAGKTTTLLALSGELPLMSGAVRMEGCKTGASLHRRARSGLSYVTEERSVFRSLTTLENLRVAGVATDRVLALFPELEKRLDVKGGLLSGGEQQMLALGRALARQPRVLLADELSMGLAPLLVDRLLAAVRRAAGEQGTGVLLVEQHARKALRYSDRVYVMRRGRVEMSATASEAIARISEIEESYLAAKGDGPAARPASAPASAGN